MEGGGTGVVVQNDQDASTDSYNGHRKDKLFTIPGCLHLWCSRQTTHQRPWDLCQAFNLACDIQYRVRDTCWDQLNNPLHGGWVITASNKCHRPVKVT